MSQFVGDWMHSPAVVVRPEIFIDQALGIMRELETSSLVVELREKRGGDYGLITAVDIRDRIAVNDCDPEQLRVRDVVAAPVRCAQTGWTLPEAAQAMQEMNLNYLPVMDRATGLVGVIALTDIFAAVEEAGWTEISSTLASSAHAI